MTKCSKNKKDAFQVLDFTEATTQAGDIINAAGLAKHPRSRDVNRR